MSTPIIKTSNFSSTIINNVQVEQTRKSMKMYVKTLTPNTDSSTINTTQKTYVNIHNKIFISLFISLASISLFIIIIYFIFMHFNNYLNIKFINKQDRLVLMRSSLTSSEQSSSDTQLDTRKIKYNIVSEAIDIQNESRQSPTDSIKLFRY